VRCKSSARTKFFKEIADKPYEYGCDVGELPVTRTSWIGNKFIEV